MQDRKTFETYLKNKNWDKADEWLQTELCFMRSKLSRNRIVCHSFGVLMSIVLAFFTWVVLFPSADEKELIAFPLATVCHNLFNMLCETVPGGKAVVIIGLLLIPFLVSLILAIVSLIFKSRKYINSNKGNTKNTGAREIEEKLTLLSNVYNKYDDNGLKILLYFLFTGVLTGGIMVISSAPGGLNPFEYIFVGLVCDVVYFLVFMGCAFVFSWFREIGGAKRYPTYDWKKIVEAAIGEGKPKTDAYIPVSSGVENTVYYQRKFDEYYAQYMGLDYETEEERAKRIVREVEEDLSGRGYGDY